MALRITRRTFVGWLVRSAGAAAAIGLLPAGSVPIAYGEARSPLRGAGSQGLPLPPGGGGRGTKSGFLEALEGGPVPVRMADLVLEGRDLRAGLADGVTLPSQGGDAWGLTAERPGATYTTPTLQAIFACTHVGVHWRTDGGDQRGLHVEVRASRDGQAWMPWRSVMPESHGPDRPDAAAGSQAGPEGPETFGALVGARLGSWFQARLTFDEAGPEAAAIRALTLTCLDSRRPAGAAFTPRPPRPTVGEGEPRASSEPLPSPSRGGGAGGGGLPGSEGEVFLRAGLTGFLERVVTREAWGADESLRFKDGVDLWPTAFVTPSLLVVHHTATDNDYGDAEAEIRSIYTYHAVVQGWGDIAYHLLIDSSGQVYEGRRGREPDASGQREIVSEDVVGGHALDYNYGSVGIALLGNFQTRAPGQAMLDTLVESLAFMARRAGLDPTTSMSYIRSRSNGTALWRDRFETISGHRDCLPTECPGNNVYPLLPAIRQRVEEQLGERGPAVRITRGPAERNAWPGDLVFGWEGDPSAVETSARLAGWRRLPGSDAIEPLSGYLDDERPAWGPWSRDRALSVPLPPDARGIYTLLVRARDGVGHEGRVSARWPVVVDRHVVVDDVDALRTRHEGSWERSSNVLGYYGTGYQVAAPGQQAASFRWQLAVPESGRYAVQASWTEAPDRTDEAHYQVSQGGQPLADGTVSQQEPGGKWTTLVEVPLVAGTSCTVDLDGATDAVTVADAIRLVLVSS
jgi:hypothetical protein